MNTSTQISDLRVLLSSRQLDTFIEHLNRNIVARYWESDQAYYEDLKRSMDKDNMYSDKVLRYLCEIGDSCKSEEDINAVIEEYESFDSNQQLFLKACYIVSIGEMQDYDRTEIVLPCIDNDIRDVVTEYFIYVSEFDNNMELCAELQRSR